MNSTCGKRERERGEGEREGRERERGGRERGGGREGEREEREGEGGRENLLLVYIGSLIPKVSQDNLYSEPLTYHNRHQNPNNYNKSITTTTTTITIIIIIINAFPLTLVLGIKSGSACNLDITSASIIP